MAEIDINNLGDAVAIANTDDILAIINGLGKNLNWAKLKEQLVKELPVVTVNSNGLMTPLNSLQIGKRKNCDVGELGVSNIWLMMQTNLSQLDFQFCFEVIDCNNYTSVKPISILLKGYNPSKTKELRHFYYSSNGVVNNILGGYVAGKLTFLVPGFSLYDTAFIRLIDDNDKVLYYGFDFTMEFMKEEPNWETRFVAN